MFLLRRQISRVTKENVVSPESTTIFQADLELWCHPLAFPRQLEHPAYEAKKMTDALPGLLAATEKRFSMGD